VTVIIVFNLDTKRFFVLTKLKGLIMTTPIKTISLCCALAVTSVPTLAKDLWITADADSVSTLKKVNAQVKSNVQSMLQTQKVVAKFDDANVLKLSKLMHDEHRRCGGFTVHTSEQEAIAASLLPTTLASFVPPVINQNTRVTNALSQLNANNIKNTINDLAGFTNRYYQTSHGVNAANSIETRWNNLAKNISWANVTAFNHSAWQQNSVILTLTGSENPDEIVIVGGHLDSISGTSTGETTIAPGADDNASGIATLTEVLTVFLATGEQPKRTIKFIGYAAEEVGLRGSSEIATQASNNNDKVLAVMQLDMTGYIGGPEDIVFMDDYTDSGLNTYLTQLLDTYQPTVNYAFSTCGYGCSDHASWHNKGYPASMPFESKMNAYNPHIHSANDTPDKLDATAEHALNFAKLATSFAIEMGFNTATQETPMLENNIPLTNLVGAKNSITNYKFIVPSEATSVTITSSGGTGDADLYIKKGAEPTTTSYDCRPYKNGNNETCNFTTNVSGEYFVQLNAYSNYSGLSLKASYEIGSTGGNSGSETNLSASTGNWVYYEVTVPAGATSFNVSIKDGSGDADLYLQQGSQPTKSSFVCRPYKNGNSETCTQTNPQAGVWHIGINAYSSFSGVNLTWQY